jgi:CheY-like chemotaxis protein
MSTFLIVDDHRNAADSLAALLRLTGHVAHPVYSATEALGQVKTLDPDIFLLDLALPDLDGYELARRLRTVAKKEARFIAVSGYGPEIGGNLAASVFEMHVQKPVTPEALLRVLGLAS